MQLEKKVSLITGAGNGIGRGIACRFAVEGASVGVLDIDAAACRCVADEIVQAGGQAVALPADVACGDEVRQAIRTLTDRFGLPTVLLHNAAIMPFGTIDQTTEEDWDRVFAVNAKGAYLTSHEVIPLMREAGGGSIIFTASVSGLLGMSAIAAYTATKGAVIALARAMAIDHAREGICVNSISPGTIDSPMFHRSIEDLTDPMQVQAAVEAHNPLGRVGTIDDVAHLFVFLASDQSSFITGANYTVDGGLSIQSNEHGYKE